MPQKPDSNKAQPVQAQGSSESALSKVLGPLTLTRRSIARPDDAIPPKGGPTSRDTPVFSPKENRLTIFVGMQSDIDGSIVWVGTMAINKAPKINHDKSTGVFKYLPGYLRSQHARPLDPVHMPLQTEDFVFLTNGGLPPPLRDALPDNWGRELIKRYCLENNVPLPLCDAQFLLFSPSDRPGNLHFASTMLAADQPAWENGAIRPGALPDVAKLHEYVKIALTTPAGLPGEPMPPEVRHLMTGLGGSRPKVSLRLADGRYIAKLGNPFKDGESNNAALEAASITMAKRCNIQTADVVLKRAGPCDILLVKRFDFQPNGVRYQMVSAMTVMQASEDPYSRTNWSYTTFARELDKWSSDPKQDKEQLFRAMVLRSMLSDCDDHPRNYSLLRLAKPSDINESSRDWTSTMGQWRLSPMYDCVAGMGEGKLAEHLAMDIGLNGREISEENILSDCEAFGLDTDQASNIMKEIERTVLTQWPTICAEMRLSQHDANLAKQSVAPLSERITMGPMEKLMTSFRDGH